MHSFYTFEDSFFQGGGGWGTLTVASTLDEIKDAVYDVLRTGWNLNSGAVLEIRAFEHGEPTATRDLYPHIRLTIPGLTEIRWDTGLRIIGGVPEPGGDKAWVIDDLEEAPPDERDERMWVLLDETLLRDEDCTVTVDWPSLNLPVLPAPLLPQDAEVELDEETYEYGFNELI